jgi:hypothetical protein
MKVQIPSIDILKECFNYTEDGFLVWKIRPESHFKNTQYANSFNARFHGVKAGSMRGLEYLYVYISGKPYSSHRIIAKMHGIDISNDIDHIDGNKINNRIENLRPATRCQNTMNRVINKTNKTGVKGLSISINKQGKKYFHCEISSNKKRHNKYFVYSEENKKTAIDWLVETRARLHEDFSNNGTGSVLLTKDLTI